MAERTVVDQVKNAIRYSDGTIKLMNVRFSFPHLGTPQENVNEQTGKVKLSYGCSFILPKETHEEAKDLCVKVIKELMAANDVKIPKAMWFILDGEEKEQEEYQEAYVVSSNEARRPSTRYRDGTVMTPEEADEEVMGGFWGHALIRPWYFNGKARGATQNYPKRIPAGLVGVQLIDNTTETFGQGRVSDEGVFGNEDDSKSSGKGRSNGDEDEL
jgi:hypothetical protein